MPRKARKKSSTNIYHVVVKGIDRQIIFEETKDYFKYLDILELYKDECNFMLYAYCLMSNHIHLIIQVQGDSLSSVFRRINTHYAIWFNMKYHRTGPMQDGRFHSEPIEDIRYLFAAIKYVHLNPTHAGLESAPGASYPWSSIYEYVHDNARLIDIDSIRDYIHPEKLLDFDDIDDSVTPIDIENIKVRTPDDVAKDIILQECACNNVSEFLELPLSVRNAHLVKLHALGLSYRQLNRLTGVPLGVIQRAIVQQR